MITLSHDSTKGAVVLGGFFDESADEGVFAVNEAATSSAEVMQTPCDMHGIHETSSSWQVEVPRVLFLGICLDFYYCLRRVLVPKFGFHFDRGSVSQALVKPRLVPP